MSPDDRFEILPSKVMRDKYGLTAEKRPAITLDPAKVPPGLRQLIPLAEQFGISDDLIREDVLAKTPRDQIRAARDAVTAHNAQLDEWLAGPESYNPKPSAEYIAFTCLM